MRVLAAVATLSIVHSVYAGGALPVDLSVEEVSGVARKNAPASGGIPLPWGVYPKDQAFSVFLGEKEIPAQVSPLVVDEKGMLRWVLVDVLADFDAKEKKSLTLKAAKGTAKAPVELKVTENPSGVTVDTGKVKFSIAKDSPFSLFTTAEVDGKAVLAGGEASYVDVTKDEKRCVADKPESITLDYSGPLRVTVCVKGRFGGGDDGMRYIARITAWAGRSDVQVKYSLSNSSEKNYSWRRIKDSSILLKFAAEPSGSIVGTGKPGDAGTDVWMKQSGRVYNAGIHGDDSLGSAVWYHKVPGAGGPGGAKAVEAGKDIWVSAGKEDLSQGWIAAKAGATVVSASDLFFVEDPPRQLAVTKGALILSGITELLPDIPSPFADRARWLIDCSHLSSVYMIDFCAPAAPAELLTNTQAAKSRLHIMASPAWYFETGGLPAGKFGTQADEIACYGQWGWKFDANQIPSKPGGMFSNMPRWVAGDDNHFTSEQDTLDSLLLMYLRTGKRPFLDASETWANYFIDLQTWRTDGWKWKDGGVWWSWKGSPIGNMPQRKADPVTGLRDRLILPGGDVKAGKHSVKDQPVDLKIDLSRDALNDIHFLVNAKSCFCHNWGEGVVEWFLITGERDALEAAIDAAELNYDTQKRGFGKAPGKACSYSRDFTRSCYLVNAVRLCAPADEFVKEASDYLARVYLERPNREPRGFLNGTSKTDRKSIEQRVGPNGMAKMTELGVTFDDATGELSDPKTGAKWRPLADQQTWMFPPLSRAMELYYRLTGNEDAQDWLIAYGEAAAKVLYQKKHGNLSYGGILMDFPVKGFCWDRHSWNLPADSVDGKGEAINGYLACFYPDVAARAYALTGEPILKQRAFEFWKYGSHRGYNSKDPGNFGKVAAWANCNSTHSEYVCFTGRMFYEWSHERKDALPPKAVTDLKVKLEGDKATVSFTAPADEGGGTPVRYQLKCSDKPIVSYEEFLKAWEANKDSEVANWWMAANLSGEPVPGKPGSAENFSVSGVPASARYFAVCVFDDSSNRSQPGNVAEAGK